MMGLNLRAAGQQPSSLSREADEFFFPIRSLIMNIIADHPQPLGEFP
jgi:hypothetical protein